MDFLTEAALIQDVARLEGRIDEVEKILTTLLAGYAPSSLKSEEEQANDWPTIPWWLWDYKCCPPGEGCGDCD